MTSSAKLRDQTRHLQFQTLFVPSNDIRLLKEYSHKGQTLTAVGSTVGSDYKLVDGVMLLYRLPGLWVEQFP